MHFGKWEIIRELGRGGQGVAYIATDREKFEDGTDKGIFAALNTSILEMGTIQTRDTRRKAAQRLLEGIKAYLNEENEQNAKVLKVLHEPIRNDPKAKERLRRELAILGNNFHPNIMKIIDASVEEGWYVSPHYSLGTLSNYKDRYKGKPLEALIAIRPIVEAVASLHREKIVHRDIKPENIFATANGLVLGDFGIAHLREDDKARFSDTYENVGSRDWMPAWAMGQRLEDVRPSFDVFGLAKVLWSMVSGKTKLLLWYYNRSENDLTKIFPTDPNMLWINRLLGTCIVENEEDCSCSTAEILLREIDDAVEIMRHGGQVINQSATRLCTVCGNGAYKLVGDYKTSTGATIANLGLNPGAGLRVYRCLNCGHIQFFQVVPNPPAWGEIVS